MIIETTHRRYKTTYEQTVKVMNADPARIETVRDKKIKAHMLIPLSVTVYSEAYITTTDGKTHKEPEKIVNVAIKCFESVSGTESFHHYVPGTRAMPAFMKEVFEFIGKTDVVEAQHIKYKEN